MSKFRTLLATAILLPVLTTSAVPYVYPGHPQCPWESPNNTWVQFLTQAHGGREPFFSIHFSRHIGDIEGGQCYTISYRGNQNWSGSGKIRTIRQHTSKSEGRHGGDPTNYQINVWGAMFTFNEAGEVIYTADGQRAGTMYCRIGSECWK